MVFLSFWELLCCTSAVFPIEVWGGKTETKKASKQNVEPTNAIADECVLLMKINTLIIDFANPFGDSDV